MFKMILELCLSYTCLTCFWKSLTGNETSQIWFVLKYIPSDNSVNYSNKVPWVESGTFSNLVLNGRIFFNTGVWDGLSDTGVVVRGGEFCLSSSLSMRIRFSSIRPLPNLVKLEGRKGVSMLGPEAAFKSSGSFFQLKSTSSRSDTWYPLVSMSCAPTPESTSSLFSIVPCWLRVIRTRAC